MDRSASMFCTERAGFTAEELALMMSVEEEFGNFGVLVVEAGVEQQLSGHDGVKGCRVSVHVCDFFCLGAVRMSHP